jgi:hemoglobin
MRNWSKASVRAAVVATLLIGTAFSATAAADGSTAPTVKKEKSLYKRLGGKKKIQKVVDEFIANVAADTRISQFFAKTDIPRLKTLLVDQICEATGGPCTYTGRPMKETHVGMGISSADFGALVEDLVKALDKNKVKAREKNEFLAALGEMKDEIVEKP